ncbi:hypothetical protein [Curtobacterium pusillum]|uniref:hypothetical protein n=1 Tax=Curtobacterium pusillum TaxID=69373 RepID=UPI0011A7021E|nr:hypothetical protein [Curtobacterium pusillum]
MDTGWTSAAVSGFGALVAVASVVVTVSEGRRARRNTEFLGHRDHWWQRWSWVVERALSGDERQRDAAVLMVEALMTRAWATDDDKWVERSLDDHETTAARRRREREEGSDDDLRRR